MFCQNGRILHGQGMKLAISIFALCSMTLGFVSCGTGGVGYNPTGLGPFDGSGNYVEAWADSPDQWKKVGSPPKTDDKVIELAKRDETPVVPVNSRPTEASVTVSSQPEVRTISTPKPTPKPKPKPAPPKPKKPATLRYTVRKGDTLYGIATKNNVSVGALQRANGIKGSVIHPGKVLVIPR